MISLEQLILLTGLCLVTPFSAQTIPNLPKETKSLLMQKATEQPSQNTLCGGVLSSSNGTNEIFYKPFDPIAQNERCVWILAMPGAVGYNVDILYMGEPTNQPGMGQELLFTGVRSTSSGTSGLNSVLPETRGSVRISDSNLLIITFASSSEFYSNSTGFALSLEGILRGNISATSALSTHHFIQSPVYDFKYPVNSTTYANYELAAFVIPPSTNNQSISTTQVLYKRDTLESSCYDYITVFKFRSFRSERWELDAALCSDLETYNFHHNDISLMLFQSDARETFGGFWLYAYPGTPCDYTQ